MPVPERVRTSVHLIVRNRKRKLVLAACTAIAVRDGATPALWMYHNNANVRKQIVARGMPICPQNMIPGTPNLGRNPSMAEMTGHLTPPPNRATAGSISPTAVLIDVIWTFVWIRPFLCSISSTSEAEVAAFRDFLVSDFFCPNAGGVETHIYFLAHCLLQSGHKVIVVTHAYGPRMGVRYLSNGLKTFSSMAHEGMFHGWSMGLRTVFTDHSLFGFADASAILTNKLVLQYSLANVSRVICVSYTSKENTVLRGGLAASKVSVIPNAINSDLFKPDPTHFKGADLLAKVIPHVCAIHPTVRFIIGGEGPKRVDVEEMRERHGLQERVIMLGTLPHTQNEKRGLHVVSTRVGGIPEVLPEEFIITTDPIPNRLVTALLKAIRMREHGELMAPEEKHRAVRHMYYWPDISTRTESVYAAAMNERPPSWCEGILRSILFDKQRSGVQAVTREGP
uniref:PIGA domain-containing protein n=1 Tax=Ascaris lumbricoides TaxID=6252 RepID=A0A0M3IFA4_ASCLU